ncbi:beta-lactamase family protein [Nocardia sp. 2]|uniref:Beta-lactamase family protein n=1 Tax=Nocardia acididurans TaxID=2802282 RepID=A0ABS1MFJ1_9NOCA|nr:serine hydrolase domain-containing protein [Nocardia acididurans]MBL1079423.1 beta-lactamase family protein [Nocardia acididurans]
MRELVIHGHAEDGYGKTVDAFRRNFAERGEVGAAVAVYDGEKPLVDLWAGYRDRARRLPWERDTLAPVYSCTKGVAALVVATLVAAGHLDYEQPVARYWPEFGAHGKAAITVRDLLDHRAALHALHGPRLTIADLADLDRVAAVLAEQRPAWAPGGRQGYHTISFGLFLNELVRRADPRGRTIGQVLAEDIAGPLDLDFSIGSAGPQRLARLATLVRTGGLDLRHERDIAWRLGIELLVRRGDFYRSTLSPDLGMPERFDRPDLVGVEVCGSNGIGNARSLARLYAAAVTAAPKLPVGEGILRRMAGPSGPAERDAVLRVQTRFHLGFRRSCSRFAFGSADHRAYGAPGLGGALGFADPATGLAFGYVPNRLGLTINGDVRCRDLFETVFGVRRP